MDITKCTGVGCDRRKICYRFTAEYSGRQSWFMNPPVVIYTQECEMYWGEESESIMNQLESIMNPCKHIKRKGESCMLNDNCKYPNCQEQD